MTSLLGYECDHLWEYIRSVARRRCKVCKRWESVHQEPEVAEWVYTAVSSDQLGPAPVYNFKPCASCNCQDVGSFGAREIPAAFPCLDAENTRMLMTPEERTKIIINELNTR